jgi:hypothetical protein
MILKYIPSYEAENDELGYDPEDFANAMAIAKVYIAQGEEAGLRAQLRAEMHVSEMIDELLSDAGGSGLRTMSSDDLAEGHGNYAGDRPVNLGGVSMKKIQIGDTVRYIDQQAQVVDMSPDRKYSRITIPSSATTKTVLTSDLRQLGQGMRESDDEQLDELSFKDIQRGARKISQGFKKFTKNVADTGVQNVGGDAVDRLETNVFTIKKQIDTKKAEIQDLEAQLSKAEPAPAYLSKQFSAQVPNPATGKPWTQAELAAQAAPAASNATATTATSATPFQVPGAVTNPGTVKPNFGQQNTGYKSVNNVPKTSTAVAETRIATALKKPVAEMLQMVETKEDVQRIKQFVDQTFVRYGAVNESAFTVRNQILELVTQVGAQRRRDFAAQQTH